MHKKILITGANGLLGKEVVNLLQPDYSLHTVTRSDFCASGTINYKIDFSSSWDSSSLPEEIDTIIHLSQSQNFRNFPEKAEDIFKVNIESTSKLLDFGLKTGIKRFVFASSGGVYGSGSHRFTENSPLSQSTQLGYYLGSKLCGEILSQNYSNFFDVIILRFFFMYGKYQKRDMLIPRLVDNVKSGKEVTLNGENGISLNPIHVSDAAQAMKAALKLKGSHTFNIAGPEVLSIRDISNQIASLANLTPKFNVSDSPPMNIVANIDAMKRDLFNPQVRFLEGVRELF